MCVCLSAPTKSPETRLPRIPPTPNQTARRTELEGMKHALVVRKKCCRAQTGSAWKQLRAGMERALAARLADQQAQLDEELAFVQVGSRHGIKAGSLATWPPACISQHLRFSSLFC